MQFGKNNPSETYKDDTAIFEPCMLQDYYYDFQCSEVFTHHVVIHPQFAQLGNMLFEFASTYGIAMANQRQLVLSAKFLRMKNLFPNIFR